MKLSSLLIVLAVVLILCACWLRFTPRRSGPDGTPTAPARRDDHRALNAWQGAIKLDPGSGYAPDAETTRRLQEKLRREEQRQRPQEGRN
jgi:hypothetical protein